MIDNIAPLYRMSWLRDHPFDPELKYAWGIDLEASYQAREEGRTLWVHEGSRITKITDIAYTLDRMEMSAAERRTLAGANMTEVLKKRYGPDWWEIMMDHKEYMR